MNGRHLRLVPAVDAAHERARPRFSTWAPFPIAGLIAVAALIGLFAPSIFARETEARLAQRVAQDWVDLVLVAPGLCVAGALAYRGSLRARLVVGALLLYAAYVFAVFAVAMHTNALFLVHCAVLGAATYALIDLGASLQDGRAWLWFADRSLLRANAIALLAAAGVFAALWLARAVPASLAGEAPDLGLALNPLHVALALPAMLIVGVGLLRHRARLATFAPMLVGFAVLLAVATGAMVTALALRGVSVDVLPGLAMVPIAVVCAVVLALLLRSVTAWTTPSLR
jgi:hypothetical protein